MGVHRSVLGIGGTIDEPRHSCIQKGAGTHRTRLYGNIKGGASQTPCAKEAGCFSKGSNFCVGCGVVCMFFFIVGGSDDEVFVYHQGADGDFSFSLCFLASSMASFMYSVSVMGISLS